jgi:hypothetical protein
MSSSPKYDPVWTDQNHRDLPGFSSRWVAPSEYDGFVLTDEFDGLVDGDFCGAFNHDPMFRTMMVGLRLGAAGA